MMRKMLRSWRVRGWAVATLMRGRAVIVDTETTDLDGRVCEVSVLDVRGRVVLTTLVDPQCPVAPAAAAVHGISDADLVDAPTFAEVLPRLLSVTRGRRLLAYNADFDRTILVEDARRCGVDPEHLALPHRWRCLMRARAVHEGGTRWRGLGAAHRAEGDCRAALRVLHELAHAPVAEPAHSPGLPAAARASTVRRAA